jgi:hypothetical protein
MTHNLLHQDPLDQLKQAILALFDPHDVFHRRRSWRRVHADPLGRNPAQPLQQVGQRFG